MEKGLIHIYTGDGKGKSTAACGLALRAYGAGFRVKVVRFFKTEPSGECKALKKLLDERMEIYCFETPHPFFWEMNDQEKEVLRQQVRQGYQFCLEAAQGDTCDLLFADEILGALHAGFVTEEEMVTLMTTKAEGVELVLTGRNAPQSLIGAADYVSEIHAVKHPFEQGISAREGIEF